MDFEENKRGQFLFTEEIYIFDAFKDASYESNSKNVKDADTIIL